MTTKKECVEYIVWEDDYGSFRPCHCPKCGGFLKWDKITDDPICNKCGVELIAYPDVDEETGKTLEWGKICVIGKGGKLK